MLSSGSEQVKLPVISKSVCRTIMVNVSVEGGWAEMARGHRQFGVPEAMPGEARVPRFAARVALGRIGVDLFAPDDPAVRR